MCNSFCYSWNIKEKRQVYNIGITSAFIGNFIFLDPSSSFICSSLALFSQDLTNISPKL